MGIDALSSSDWKTIQKCYGLSGVTTVENMGAALSAPSLVLTFDSVKEIFTILNTSHYSTGTISKLLKEKEYKGWKPECVSKDVSGNCQIILKCIPSLAKGFVIVDHSIRPIEPVIGTVVGSTAGESS